MDQPSPEIPHSSHARVREIARKVAGAPLDRRRQVLEAECDGDRVLRSRVEMMLLRQDQVMTAAELPEQPAPAKDFAIVDRIGRYSVVRLLGEGGMGVVYLAEQERPKRTVALKVIRPGLLTPRLLRRFELESETLAKLQHPGIASIFEAATHDSPAGPQPYFAMELVEGRPLTLYAFENHLTLKQKLELFGKVCDAVQHAHQKGVIHRDLKPSNILVTAEGQPKILDFGIARATDQAGEASGATMRTEAGTLVGTLPYMSPEQVNDPSGVDVRSDVYTLGVILFELLAGKLPHALDTHTLPEAVRIIAEAEAPSLKSIDRTLPSDVATITSKAMEKDRARRYQSASDLGADIARYLHNEPILARPPSRTYRMRKFVRRNRALVAGVSLAFVALVGGVIGTTWQAAEATRGRRLAEERGVALERQTKIAEREAETARAVNRFLTRMLEGANPESDGSGDVSVQQLLASAIDELEQATPPPSVEVPVRVTIAGTFRGMGRFKEAIPQMERACEVASREFGETDDRTLDAKRNLAFAYADAGRTEEAEEVTSAILPIIVRKHGEDSLEAARVRCELGRVLIERGKLTDAEGVFRAGLAVLRPKLGESDREVQQAMHNFGTSLSALGKLDEAESLLRQTAALREATYGKDHLLVAYTLNSLTSVLQRQGKKEESLALLEKVLAMRLKHLQPDHPSVLVSKGNLAVGLVGVGRASEAEPLLRQVAEAQARTIGETHQKTLSTLGNLAYVLEESKRPAEAEALYRRILALRKQSGQMDADSWNQFNNLAMLLQAQKRYDEALELYEELLAGCRGRLPEDHWALAIYRNNYGQCLTEAGRYEAAEKELSESHAVLLAFFKEGHPRVKKSQDRLDNLARESKLHGLKPPTSASK